MKDLTKGNPFKQILLFALPVWVGAVLNQLFNMVDTIVVGNTVNADALTGVGLTGSITFLVFGFVDGLTSGFSVRVAQRFGAGDEEGVRRAVGTSFLLCIFMAILLTAIATPLTGVLLHLINTPEQYYDYAYYYLVVIFGGMSALIFCSIMAGTLRAIGDSKVPLFAMMSAGALNVGLNFAFILGLKMFYTGAAIATILSQLVAGTVCLVYMLKKYPVLRVKLSDMKFDSKLAAGHLSQGLPMALQFSITAIGCIVQQAALNGLNATAPGVVTAYTASNKIDVIAAQSFAALGVAIATYAGQNCGAGRYDRVKQGVRVGMIYVAVSAVLGFAFCMGLCEPLMKLFLNTEKGGTIAQHYDEVIAYGKQYLFCQSVLYVFLGTIYIYRSTLQGIGKSAITMFAGVSEVVGRVVASLVFVQLWGFTGICFSNPVAWVAADLFLTITYYILIRRAGKDKPEKKRRHRSVPAKSAL